MSSDATTQALASYLRTRLNRCEEDWGDFDAYTRDLSKRSALLQKAIGPEIFDMLEMVVDLAADLADALTDVLEDGRFAALEILDLSVRGRAEQCQYPVSDANQSGS